MVWTANQAGIDLFEFGLLHEERRSFTEQPGLVSIKKKRNPPSDIERHRKSRGLSEIQHGIWVSSVFLFLFLLGLPVWRARKSQIPLKPPGVTEDVSGPWICSMQGWWRALVRSQPGGRGQLLWGRPESRESLSHRNPVFVYGAQCSYLPPVLTPHSSCFKSLLLIFSSLLPQPQPVLLFFGVLVLFSGD